MINWRSVVALSFTLALVGTIINWAPPAFALGEPTEITDSPATASAVGSQPASQTPPANGPVSLTISPISLLIETDPGKPVASSFQVLNNGDETEHLKVTLMKFSADQAGSQPVLQPFDASDVSQGWITFNQPNFSVEPNTWKTIQLVFSPPPEAALSYYYALVINRQSDPSVVGGATAVKAAPALLTLATVRSPLAKQELQLKGFRATKHIFEFLPVEFEVEVQNTGNIHLAPIGNIFIDGPGKKEVGQLQLNKSNGLILPGSTRTYTLKWDEGFPLFTEEEEAGSVVIGPDGQPKKKLKWDFSTANLFRMGQFSAHLVFIYDNGERDIPSEARVSFMVIPWRILAVVGTVLILVIAGLLAPVIWLIKRSRRAQTP